MIYVLILLSKILENTLSTLRLIVVSNGKKKLGALLQGVIALIWIGVTGIVIININKDYLKIICFIIGSIIGSYLGSIIEEKLALGDNLLIIKAKRKIKRSNIIMPYHPVYFHKYLIIIIKRKKVKRLVTQIKKYDKDSKIILNRIKIR